MSTIRAAFSVTPAFSAKNIIIDAFKNNNIMVLESYLKKEIAAFFLQVNDTIDILIAALKSPHENLAIGFLNKFLAYAIEVNTESAETSQARINRFILSKEISTGKNIVHYAAENGRIAFLNELIKIYPDNPDIIAEMLVSRDADGNTPLNLAIMSEISPAEKEKIVYFLIDRLQGLEAISAASSSAILHLIAPNINGDTALHLACKRHAPPELIAILSQYISVFVSNNWGISAYNLLHDERLFSFAEREAIFASMGKTDRVEREIFWQSVHAKKYSQTVSNEDMSLLDEDRVKLNACIKMIDDYLYKWQNNPPSNYSRWTRTFLYGVLPLLYVGNGLFMLRDWGVSRELYYNYNADGDCGLPDESEYCKDLLVKAAQYLARAKINFSITTYVSAGLIATSCLVDCFTRQCCFIPRWMWQVEFTFSPNTNVSVDENIENPMTQFFFEIENMMNQYIAKLDQLNLSNRGLREKITSTTDVRAGARALLNRQQNMSLQEWLNIFKTCLTMLEVCRAGANLTLQRISLAPSSFFTHLPVKTQAMDRAQLIPIESTPTVIKQDISSPLLEDDNEEENFGMCHR